VSISKRHALKGVPVKGNKQHRVRLVVEQLTPGTLTITPPRFIDPISDLAVPNTAKPGLQTA